MRIRKYRDFRGLPGFTLIELLVVISVIGILASVIMTSVSSAKKKGRDARRIRDIQEIRSAIELYILANGHSPDLGTSWCTNPASYADSYVSEKCIAAETPYNIASWNTLQTQLSPYISKLSKDPCGVSCFSLDNPNLNEKGFFTYKYEAPAAIGGIAGVTSTSYAIEAENLESKNNTSFGFGTLHSF